MGLIQYLCEKLPIGKLDYNLCVSSWQWHIRLPCVLECPRSSGTCACMHTMGPASRNTEHPRVCTTAQRLSSHHARPTRPTALRPLSHPKAASQRCSSFWSPRPPGDGCRITHVGTYTEHLESSAAAAAATPGPHPVPNLPTTPPPPTTTTYAAAPCRQLVGAELAHIPTWVL